MNEGEAFIRDAAAKRGIDPDIAVRVAMSEGGTMPPGNVGKFDTGWSFWQLQLHYGGPEYPQFGTVAGMGIGFTALTGWQPGDPNAWRDATRYALNRAKRDGWGAWYGAAHVGIGRWDGIDRSVPWDASSETWDYEQPGPAPSPEPAPVIGLSYNPDALCDRQDNDYECAEESATWLLRSLGRNPSDDWMQQQLEPGIVSPQWGLMDPTGGALARWLTREYGADMGFEAVANGDVSFDDVLALAGQQPVMIGGRRYGPAGHWVGVRRADENGWLELANPAPNYTQTGTHLDRDEWAARGSWSMITVPLPSAEPAPVEPPVEEDELSAAERDELTALRVRVKRLETVVGYSTVDVANAAQASLNAVRADLDAAQAAIDTLRRQADEAAA